MIPCNALTVNQAGALGYVYVKLTMHAALTVTMPGSANVKEEPAVYSTWRELYAHVMDVIF